MAPRKKLGEMLMDQGLIDETQLRSAMGHQKNWGGKLGSALIDLGFLGEEDIARVLEGQLRQHCLSQTELVPQPEALKLMTMQDALKMMVLPLKLADHELTLAMANPFDLGLTDELGFKFGKRVKGVMAVESTIKKAIKKYYGNGTTGREYKVDLNSIPVSGTPEFIHDDAVLKAHPVEERAEPKKVEPSPELISKALAYLLIEKGIVKRDELIEKMKSLKEKGMA